MPGAITRQAEDIVGPPVEVAQDGILPQALGELYVIFRGDGLPALGGIADFIGQFAFQDVFVDGLAGDPQLNMGQPIWLLVI